MGKQTQTVEKHLSLVKLPLAGKHLLIVLPALKHMVAMVAQAVEQVAGLTVLVTMEEQTEATVLAAKAGEVH